MERMAPRPVPLRKTALAVLVAATACVGGGGRDALRLATPQPGSVPALPTGPPSAGTARSEVLLAAGDIASCQSDGDEATAALLDQRPGVIATLGDNAYPDGSVADFSRCYEPSWGRHKARTRPSPGNHEYRTREALGYFEYFRASAGHPTSGFYSYQLGTWHIVALNSNCANVSCEAGGPQERWLRADLAAHPSTCTLAYWHHARFSSGRHGSNDEVGPLFKALYDHRADVVLAGHDHDYERFAPLDPSGRPDPSGIRTFVVGTGGASHRPIERRLPGSEARNDDTYGILALNLDPGGYRWEFVPETGRSFTDSGSATCH
jgi:hypothetical protein